MPHLELRQVVVVLGHLEGEALHHGLLNRAHIRQRLLLALYHRLHTRRQSYCSVARLNEVHVEVDANIDHGLPRLRRHMSIRFLLAHHHRLRKYQYHTSFVRMHASFGERRIWPWLRCRRPRVSAQLAAPLPPACMMSDRRLSAASSPNAGALRPCFPPVNCCCGFCPGPPPLCRGRR